MVTNRGVCWNTSDNPTISNNKTSDSTGAGSFTSNLAQLTPNTQYFIRAYATNSVGTVYGNSISFNTITAILFNPALNYGSISDIDGNIYKTIQIGNQTWMAENLKTTKFNNNNAIPFVSDDIEWINLTTPAYCWYDKNEITYKSTYGALYNWYTAVDSRKICPTGWHLPSDGEWTILENYLIANGYNFDGSKNENKIAKSLAATSDWEPSEEWGSFAQIGSIGDTDFPAYRNKSGFTALPGGSRSETFGGIGNGGWWWSSSSECATIAYIRYLRSYQNFMSRNELGKGLGASVRCLKD